MRPICLSALCFLVLAQAAETQIGDQKIDRTVQLRTHSIFAPYIDQDLQNRWWDFGADAYINTNKHIRLTRADSSQMGWLWSRLPLTATNYVVEVEFKISGDNSLYGDGMALWLTQERTEPGPVFGNRNQFHGLGIFLDTYANARHTFSLPRVIGYVGDGEHEYNYNNDGDGQEIGACSANFRRTNVATKLKVTYVKGKFLDVKIQYKAWDDWSDCFRVENITLPSLPYLGFSAMTGDVFDAHDIIAVTTYSALTSGPDAHKLSSSYNNSSSGSWSGFFFKLFLFGGVCAGGYYGWKEYQRRQGYGRMPKFGGGGFGSGLYQDSKRF
ncbi:hypothetical protein E1B28_010291 [Marasmius oreades]|uniref:L-type lectin-like domain-containing protein n=1 Tax=Marasmius oreades TaxID=181124 RepID=A0A9P7RXH2_9AGAR|nr:uncharacterized protein E1B28_010291 [Marasmius oreades]KAG7091240.1 hypothetical protein E1B28_010291 [Marasmius oreades]